MNRRQSAWLAWLAASMCGACREPMTTSDAGVRDSASDARADRIDVAVVDAIDTTTPTDTSADTPDTSADTTTTSDVSDAADTGSIVDAPIDTPTPSDVPITDVPLDTSVDTGPTDTGVDIVVDAGPSLPSTVALSPSSVTIAAGAATTFTVTLDVAAPLGGTVVDLAVSPVTAGTLPAVVTVPAGTTSTTFDYVDASTTTSATVRATLGTSVSTSTVTVSTGVAPQVFISEVRSRGAGGASDEFVELYNPTSSPVTLDSTWRLEVRSNTATTYSSRWTGTGTVIAAHGHFLVTGSGYVATPAGDAALSSGVTDAASVRLTHAGTNVDAVCFGFDAASMLPFTTDATYTCEGMPAMNPHNNATSTNTDASIERRPGGAAGNATDTGDNSSDFATLMPSNPQNLTSPPTP